MKKNILIVYPQMMMGGSTTSFIQILKSIDYNVYDVDLILHVNRGIYIKNIPMEVNLLNEARLFSSKFAKMIIGLFDIKTYKMLYYFLKNSNYSAEYGSAVEVHNCRKLKKEYDVAIGGLELWANSYVLSNKVKAKKKIAWIHTDIFNAGMCINFEKKLLAKADNIVFVSEANKKEFDVKIPELSTKTIVVENMFDVNAIIKKSQHQIELLERGDFTFITVCRLDIQTKGLDRAIHLAKKLEANKINYKWYIIGCEIGQNFAKMLEESGVKNIILLGEKENPYPYYKQADYYVMLSRHEGKPMTIREAQILGLPPVVTEYASAKEQIDVGNTGIVLENKDDLYNDFIKLLDKSLINELKQNLELINYNYDEQIEFINNNLLNV